MKQRQWDKAMVIGERGKMKTRLLTRCTTVGQRQLAVIKRKRDENHVSL